MPGRGQPTLSSALIDVKPLIQRHREGEVLLRKTTIDSILSGIETVKLHFFFFCLSAVWSLVPRNEVEVVIAPSDGLNQ